MSEALIPPFFPWSEACMASLASRPEEWQIWSIEDYEFLTLRMKKGSSGAGVVKKKQRSLLSLLPVGLKTARWRAAFLFRSSSPSRSVSRLLKEEDRISHKSSWLRYVRSFPYQDDLSVVLAEFAHMLDASRVHDWSIKLRVLKMSKKDSRGRFSHGTQVVKISVFDGSRLVLEGLPEELPELLYN